MRNETFMIYYGNNACEKKLNCYHTLILDPDNYTKVDHFSASTYAYISLGEVNKYRYYFKKLLENGNVLEQNSIWESYLIKFDTFWEELLLNVIIPKIVTSGYDGIMFDNIDSLLYYKNVERASLIKFFNSIKLLFPELKIMVNRGFEIVNELNIDAILLESTISTHDFETKEYFIHENPIKYDIKDTIKCYSVDYWPKDDLETISKIHNLAKDEGYVPLVTDILLQEI